jgi:hypothetical protein
MIELALILLGVWMIARAFRRRRRRLIVIQQITAGGGFHPR